MAIRLLHRLVSQPHLYDLSQRIAGVGTANRHFQLYIPSVSSNNIVLNLGGGTGAFREFWPADVIFLNLDIEMPKLQGFVSKFKTDVGLHADALELPLKDRSVDYIQCTAVTHHLTDQQLAQLLEQSQRVLKATGQFILLDAVWNPSNWRGKLLWSLDRGSNPRPVENLKASFSKAFDIVHWHEFKVHHNYVVAVGCQLN